MSLTNLADKPATIMFSGPELEGIKLLKQEKNGKDTLCFEIKGTVATISDPIYDLAELTALTHFLMQHLGVNYKGYMKEDSLTLERFSERAKNELRPMATFLACIDGNCYRETIDQYIPHVHAILLANGLNTFTFKEYLEGNKK